MQGVALPMLPLVLPPAVQALMQPAAPNQTPEQQAHQAASLAAAVMASPYSAMMLPPSIVPMGARRPRRSPLRRLCRARTRRWPPMCCNRASHVRHDSRAL